MSNKRAIILFIISSLLYGNIHAAQNNIIPSSFEEGAFSLGAELTYLTTSANYTDRGTSLDFNGSNSYGAYQTEIYSRYNFSEQLSFSASLPMNYAMSENPTDKYSTFEIAGISASISYDLKTFFIKIIPEVKGYFAVEQFDRNSDQVLTSDGASYFDVGSHVFKNFSNLILHGFISYQYRMEGFSSLLNYQADITYKHQNLGFTFGAKGFESITEDEYSDNPAYRHSYLATVNGESLMFASVDPLRLDLFAQVNWNHNNNLNFYSALSKSIRGENSGDYLSLTAGVEYFLGSTSSDRTKYNYRDSEDFDYGEEKIDPKIEEQIKNYNKPTKKKPKPKRKIKRSSKVQDVDNSLEMSDKEFGETETSTSPIKPKSKRRKRVKVDF